MSLSMLPSEQSKWQSVGGKKTAGKKKTKDSKADAKPTKGAMMSTDPAFAVLDATWKAELEASSARAEAEGSEQPVASTSSSSISNDAKKQKGQPVANGHPAPAKKEKKPKIKKVMISSVAEELAGGPLQQCIAGAQQKYAADRGVQLEVLASFMLGSFKECELPFNKILAEQTLKQSAEVPFKSVSSDFTAPIAALVASSDVLSLASFAKALLLALLEGLPDAANSKTQPPKAKVGLLLAMSVLLRTQPQALLPLCDDLLAAGYTFTSPGHLPVLLWALCQAASADPGVAAAVWARVLLPQAASAQPASQVQVQRFVDEVVLPQLPQITAAAASGYQLPASQGTTPVAGGGSKRSGGGAGAATSAATAVPIVSPASLDAAARSLAARAAGGSQQAAKREEAQYAALRQVALASGASVFSFPELARLSIEAANSAASAAAEGGASEEEGSGASVHAVELAAANLVAALAGDDAAFVVWEGRHKNALRGSSSLLVYLASAPQGRNGPLAPLLKDGRKRGRLAATLRELRHRHRNQLASGKGWQGAAARTADAACAALQHGKQRGHVAINGSSSAGGAASSAMTFALLTTALAAAAVVAVANSDELASRAEQLVGPAAVAETRRVYSLVADKAEPYVQQAWQVAKPYAERAGEVVGPHLQHGWEVASPYLQHAGQVAAPYWQQARAALEPYLPAAGGK